jgi:hypothetical protein
MYVGSPTRPGAGALLATLLVLSLDAAARAEPPKSTPGAPLVPREARKLLESPKPFEIPIVIPSPQPRQAARCQAPVADLSCFCLADGRMPRCDTASSSIVPAE